MFLSIGDPDAYYMRMARVNLTMPDDLVARAKLAGVNISAVATAALEVHLDDQAKIAALDAYLAELEVELGPIPPDEMAEAEAWAAGLIEEQRRVHGA